MREGVNGARVILELETGADVGRGVNGAAVTLAPVPVTLEMEEPVGGKVPMPPPPHHAATTSKMAEVPVYRLDVENALHETAEVPIGCGAPRKEEDAYKEDLHFHFAMEQFYVVDNCFSQMLFMFLQGGSTSFLPSLWSQ